MDGPDRGTRLRARYLDLVRNSLIGLVGEDPALEVRIGGGRVPSTARRAWPGATGRPARRR